MEQELSFAEKVQKSFLPEFCPKSKHYEVSARNIPALSVGGDMYDFLVWSDEELSIVLGDVSGKGMPAALYMARFISDFQCFAAKAGRDNPSGFFRDLNNLLSKRTQRGMFVTVAYIYFNAKKHVITLTSAGHNPPLLWMSKETRIERLFSEKGIPMGMMPEMTYDTVSFPFNKNDIILLYTDGINEARNTKNEEFELQRLEDVFKKEVSSAETSADNIINEVNIFANNAPQHDDITIVTLQALS